jgi:hypothetical protein
MTGMTPAPQGQTLEVCDNRVAEDAEDQGYRVGLRTAT